MYPRRLTFNRAFKKSADMVEHIKEKVFRRWCNSFLLQRRMCMEDLSLDVKDGVKLCRLVELLSRKSIPSFSKTPSEQEKIQNIDALLVFLKSTEGMVHLTVNRDDILQGDVKAICSLIWSLIIHYQIQPLLPEKWTSIRESVKKLINSNLPPGNQISNFTSDWMDGTVLTMLAKEQLPLTWNPKDLYILEAAEKYLVVPKILFYEELQSPDIDEESVMTYATLLLTNMAHQHHAILSAPPNNLFVKVYTGTSITNDQMTVIQQLAKDAYAQIQDSISIEISVVPVSAEIVEIVVDSDVPTSIKSSKIKIEAQFIGSILTQIDDVTDYFFPNIANALQTSIYFLLTKQYLDDTSIPNPRYGWVNPVNPG